MKTFCITILSLFTLSAFCNDTLTREQVYNFSVGDTFDYQYYSDYNYGGFYFDQYDTSYARFIVTSLYYSAGKDTLYITRRQTYPLPVSLDTLIIDSLSQYEYLLFDKYVEIEIDSGNAYDDSISNAISIVGMSFGQTDTFAEGLGVVYEKWGYFDGIASDGWGSYAYNLIYHTNANKHWGTPYEVVSGMQFSNYVPIPEQCATWVRTVYNYDSDTAMLLQEKVTEGSEVPFHNHAYIPLYYSYYNYSDKGFTEDSMLGYFRNDTINRSAYLYHSLSDTSWLTYDFTTQVGDNGICGMDTLSFSTGFRARWLSCDFNYNNSSEGMIEGVGGGGSIWPVQFPRWNISYDEETIALNGILTSFCVCGTTLYNKGSGAACEISTGINQIQPSLQINVYPNPSTGSWQLTVDNSLVGSALNVFDDEGKLVFNSELKTQNSKLELNVPSGVYYLRIVGADPRVGPVVKKLVKM